MASKTIMVCDRCEQDGETVESAIRRELHLQPGEVLEVDLCAKHNTELDRLFEALEEWRAWARPKEKSRSRSRSRSRSESSAPAASTAGPPPQPAAPSDESEPTVEVMRSWARSNGFSVGDRGRLAPEVVEAYQNRPKPEPAAV